MRTFSFCTILALSLWLPFQSRSQEIGTGGLHFQVGIPQGAFADAYDKIGFGGDLDLFFKLGKNLPVYAGLNLSLMAFEQHRRRYDLVIGGFEQEYRLRVASNLFSAYTGIRIMPGNGPLRPYAEGLIGLKNFFRTSRLDLRDNFSFEWNEVDSDNDGNWALGYGGSAGLMYFFGASGIALDLKCSYLAGQPVDYYQIKAEIDPVEFEEDPFSAFEKKRSATHMLIPQVGVVFRFTPLTEEMRQLQNLGD